MYIRPCEHPLRLKVQGKWQYVACGKCPTCQNRKSSRIVERLMQESQCHAYTCFFTLTYDEKHVPKLFLNPHSSPGKYELYDPEREVFVDCSEIKGFNPSSRLYIHRRKEIPYAYMKDVQDFFKRLRYYISSSLKFDVKENKKIRYYVVSEYGPTTYRPHYHGLIWFDSRQLALRIHEFIRKSWSLGRIDAQFAFGKSEQYVARYVSCTTGLPKVYLHREIRPRSCSSSSPAIGTLQTNEKEIREIFENGLVERTLFVQSTHKANVSPLWRTFEARLFPKLSGFSDLTHYERVTLYSVYSSDEYEDYVGFAGWIEKRKRQSELKGYSTWLIDYLWNLLQQDKNTSSYVERWHRIKSVYYCSSRVYHQRHVFGCSLDYYVDRIENYYSNKSLFQLRNFYAFQENYSRDKCTSVPLIKLYVYKCRFDDNGVAIPYFTDEHLRSFGMSEFGSLSKSAFWKEAEIGEKFNSMEFISLNHKIWFNSMKSKKQNDYLEWCHKKQLFNFNLEKKYE